MKNTPPKKRLFDDPIGKRVKQFQNAVNEKGDRFLFIVAFHWLLC
jgi:hypothetical protein